MSDSWVINTLFVIFLISSITAMIVFYFKNRNYRKLQKNKEFEIVPIVRNFDIWQSLKKKYLQLAIAIFVTWIISLAFAIAGIILVSNNNFEAQPPETYWQLFTSSPFVVVGCFFISLFINAILYYRERHICSKLFYNKNFVEDVNLKKMKWFFQTNLRLNAFITLHSSFLALIFAIIIYKDIEKNKINELQTENETTNTRS
ncbi:MAG: hypothetical protein ACRDCH_00080 [Metamycoplasmataceae bacterium]